MSTLMGKGLDNFGWAIIKGVTTKILQGWIMCQVDIQMMDNLEGVISQDLLGHEISTVFTDTDPVSMIFFAHRGKGCIIHMVVDGFIEFKRKQRTNIIGSPSCHTNWNTLYVIRVAVVENKADVDET